LGLIVGECAIEDDLRLHHVLEECLQFLNM
jgi:hypothetical protein